MSKFDFAVQYTLELEGVFSNHKADPGGKTKFGITEKLWNAYWADEFVDTPCPAIETITKAHAIAVYKDVFWDHLRLDRVSDVYVATEVFDSAVNVGPGDAVKFLQRAINYCRLPDWERIKEDGALGPITRGKVKELIDLHYRENLLIAMNGFQFIHYVEQDNPYMSRGWTERLKLAAQAA